MGSIQQLISQLVMWIGTHLLARPVLQPLNRLIFGMALRGMGVLNYKDMAVSGEAWFLSQLAYAWSDSSELTGPTILDVGANVGSYTAEVLKAMPSADVHAFEPHPRTVGRLRRRMDGTAKIIPAAVGSSPGSLELYDYEDAHGSSHASPYRGVFTEIHRRPTTAITVPVIKIDEYIRKAGLPKVLLLKIDTEGHELEVLRGAERSLASGKIQCLQFEFNGMNIVSRTFLSDFTRLLPDFDFFRLLPRGMTPLRGRPVDEIFAFQNIVGIRRDSPVYGYLVNGGSPKLPDVHRPSV